MRQRFCYSDHPGRGVSRQCGCLFGSRFSFFLAIKQRRHPRAQAKYLYKSLMLFFTALLLMEGLLYQDLASEIIVSDTIHSPAELDEFLKSILDGL